MGCDVCQGSKKITVACWAEPESMGVFDDASDSIDVRKKDFPCPQCQMVPYRRVRATKVVTDYPAEEYARYQVPIERSLAARFGEYLMREGLIKFTTSGSADFGAMAKKITVTAHLGVVQPADVARAGAVDEVAMTARPPLPERLRLKARARKGARRWEPNVVDLGIPREEITDEFDEPKDALGARFSGLEIG